MYKDSAMNWFEERVVEILAVRLRLCEGCPVLLASVHFKGVNISERMRELGYGVAMPDSQFAFKCKSATTSLLLVCQSLSYSQLITIPTYNSCCPRSL